MLDSFDTLDQTLAAGQMLAAEAFIAELLAISAGIRREGDRLAALVREGLRTG